MFLKRIELQGFKSFADKTIIQLKMILLVSLDQMVVVRAMLTMRYDGYLVNKVLNHFVQVAQWQILFSLVVNIVNL